MHVTETRVVDLLLLAELLLNALKQSGLCFRHLFQLDEGFGGS